MAVILPCRRRRFVAPGQRVFQGLAGNEGKGAIVANTDQHQHMGAKVIDSRGHPVGKVANVFYDDHTLEPQWVAVKLGVLHRRSPLVPLDQSYFSEGGDLVVAFTEDTIKDAPAAHETAPTSREAEHIAQHYGVEPPHQS
jgi:hypothetical protein